MPHCGGDLVEQDMSGRREGHRSRKKCDVRGEALSTWQGRNPLGNSGREIQTHEVRPHY